MTINTATTRHIKPKAFFRWAPGNLFASALGVLLLAGTAGVGAYRHEAWRHWLADYRTDVGKRRVVTLDDDTRILLNSDTSLDVRYDNAQRLVRLHRGEIMIVTGHGDGAAGRPFRVATAQGQILALGTRLNVRQLDGLTRVSVFQHAAEIQPAQTLAMRRLEAGEGVRFSLHAIGEVERVSEQVLDSELGQFNLVTYRDSVENDVHMALTLGSICAEEPTLVRVHNMDPLRDLFMVNQPGRWSLRAAMKQVAADGSGVVLLLGNPLTGPDLLAHLERQLGGETKVANPTTYSTVGAGSQILRDLGVRKMRLMSSPMKFNAISGFDLEVVEYLPSK